MCQESGFTYESFLFFKDRIKSVIKTIMLFLQNLSHLRSHFVQESYVTAMHAFFYFSSWLVQLSFLFLLAFQRLFSVLTQVVKNYAVHLLFHCNKLLHITPLSYDFYCLPIKTRFYFIIFINIKFVIAYLLLTCSPSLLSRNNYDSFVLPLLFNLLFYVNSLLAGLVKHPQSLFSHFKMNCI